MKSTLNASFPSRKSRSLAGLAAGMAALCLGGCVSIDSLDREARAVLAERGQPVVADLRDDPTAAVLV
ncbi:MAG: hypothetical protein AAGA57_10655, partial [Planctomycetota bacterium]